MVMVLKLLIFYLELKGTKIFIFAFAGYGPNISSTNLGDQRAELPSNTQGLPTLEALTTVLHRTEQLLSGQAVSALSVITTSHLYTYIFSLSVLIRCLLS